MFGHFPVCYTIRLRHKDQWWLKKCEEGTSVCTWTDKSTKAQVFSSKSACDDYQAKYLSGRDTVTDEKIINPYMYLGGV